MIIRGITSSRLTAIASDLQLEFENFRAENGKGTAFGFRLRPISSRGRYSRRNWRQTHFGPWVCYHGFRDFITEVFKEGATSVNTVGWGSARSSINDGVGRKRITFKSLAAFQAHLHDYKMTDVTPPAFDPVPMVALCDCPERVDSSDWTPPRTDPQYVEVVDDEDRAIALAHKLAGSATEVQLNRNKCSITPRRVFVLSV